MFNARPFLQMLSYETQLKLKRDVIVRAYSEYSGTPLDAFERARNIDSVQIYLRHPYLPSSLQ